MSEAFSFGHPPPPSTGQGYFVKVLGSTNPEPVTTVAIRSDILQVYGYKAVSATENTNNSGTVYLGFSPLVQLDPLEPGGAFNYPERNGGSFDARKLYVRGAVGDGVTIAYNGGPTDT